MVMARIRTLSPWDMRHLLMALLAIALVLRLGGGCEAMAATPTTPAAHKAHCADTPAKPAKPAGWDRAVCGLCIALPDGAIAKVGATSGVPLEPTAGLRGRLVGLERGPAPPPPKIA